ncbi:MAG: serine protease [Syntrophaceae bacterium]|nr:serine protease [Syntrophaceae bacterium]
MKTLFNILLFPAVLLGVLLLVYRRRLGELWTDLRNLFSNRFVLVGLPVFVLAVVGILYWAGRDQLSPPAPVVPGPEAGVPVAAPPTPAPTGTALQDVSALYRKIGPSVVAIYTYNERRENLGRGSGFFHGASGQVVTNLHVLRAAHSAQIKTAAGKVYPVAGITARDVAGDLALLSVTMPWAESLPLAVTAALPEVGERVIVVGSPFGLEQTVSDGIVSAIRETEERGRVLQITAPISPGSSGSPVVNLRGEVIGVAFLQFSGGQNLNFCISGERVTRLAAAAGTPVSLAGGTAASGVAGGKQTFCYLDEKGTVRFSDSTTNPRYSYQLISAPDGSLDRNRYERWVFEQIGGNPQDIDPQAAVTRAKEDLPNLFRQVFSSQYDMSDLPNMPEDARNHWERVVNHHLANAYNGAVQKRNRAILQYRVMMDAFQIHAISRR